MSGHRFDTYGWTAADIDDIAREVERRLPIRMQPHDSLYRGEYYGWRGGGAHLILQQNVSDQDDGMPTDSQYPGHAVLLYASELPDEWFEQLSTLPGVQRLESIVLP
jgi:hypothetical protein